MPTLIESAARADHTKGAAIWARPAMAPALTIVRRFTAPPPRRLVICSSLNGFFRSVILPAWLEVDKGAGPGNSTERSCHCRRGDPCIQQLGALAGNTLFYIHCERIAKLAAQY